MKARTIAFTNWRIFSLEFDSNLTKLEDGNYELVDDDRMPLADIPVYINVRNERRFFRKTPIKESLAEDRREWAIHLKISLRQRKALHLYHMIREYKLFDWWD